MHGEDHSARTSGLLLPTAARRALVRTLFLIGLGLSRKTLKSVGVRPFVLRVVLWAALGVGTLAAIRAGLIAMIHLMGTRRAWSSPSPHGARNTNCHEQWIAAGTR